MGSRSSSIVHNLWLYRDKLGRGLKHLASHSLDLRRGSKRRCPTKRDKTTQRKEERRETRLCTANDRFLRMVRELFKSSEMRKRTLGRGVSPAKEKATGPMQAKTRASVSSGFIGVPFISRPA